MSLKLVMYSSVAMPTTLSAQVSNGLLSIVKDCIRNNHLNEISGVLYYRHGRYLQIIEGESTKIDQLMSNILSDDRHTDCLIQLHTEISQRTFDRWHPLINISLADPYLQKFLNRYSAELKALSPECRVAFNHFFEKAKSREKTKVTQQGYQNSLNVFGDHVIRLNGKPDFSKSKLTPLMVNVCRLLARQARTFEQLVAEYGPSKRDEIMVLLRALNHKGLLRYGEDDMASVSNGSCVEARTQSKTRLSSSV